MIVNPWRNCRALAAKNYNRLPNSGRLPISIVVEVDAQPLVEIFHFIDRLAKFRTYGASFLFNDLWPRSTIFVRTMNASMDCNVDMLTSYGWYVACSWNLLSMGFKLSNNFSEADRNWQWPQKTWFRERLNAVKAQENGQRRKLVITPRQSAAATPAIETQPDTLKVD